MASPDFETLFQPPRMRGANTQSNKRHASWLELFYDLVFVAAISQLGLSLSHEYSISGLLHFVLLFVPIWWAWVGHTFYLTRFESDDVTDRLLTFGQMIFVASLAVHVPLGLGEHSVGFALSYIGVRLILIAQYWRAGKYLPQARPLTFRYIFGFSLAVALWFLSLLVPPPFRFVLWILGIVIDFLTPLLSMKATVKVPPHYAHLPERFGLFTIIVLGEAVIATVQETSKQILHGSGIFIGLFGFLIAFSLWWIYFDSVQAAEARSVQSRDATRSYYVWLYIHLPLTISITVAALGVKKILMLEDGAGLSLGQGWILCGAMALCMVCLNIIFLNAPNIAHNKHARHYLRPHYVLTAITLACGLFATRIAPALLVAIIAALNIGQVLVALRRTPASAKKH